MRYKEIETAVLSLINQYSIAGEEVSPAYNNQADYTRRIPGLINHAIMDIRTSVKPKRGTYRLVKGEETEDGWIRYTLPKYFWKLCSGGVRIQTSRGLRRTNAYQLYGNQILVRKGKDEKERYVIEYYAYPEQIPSGIKPDELPDIEVNEEQDIIQIAEYFAAAQLVMQEDEFAYTTLYRMYETRLARLTPELTVEVHTTDDAYYAPPPPFAPYTVSTPADEQESKYQTEEQVRAIVSGMLEGGGSGVSFKTLNYLPPTGTSGVIYLVRNGLNAPNAYDEYIWVDKSFEKIGADEATLLGDTFAEEINRAIAEATKDFVTEDDLSSALEPYATKEDVNSAIASMDDSTDKDQNDRIAALEETVSAQEGIISTLQTKNAEQASTIKIIDNENDTLKKIIAASDADYCFTAGPSNVVYFDDAKSEPVRSLVVEVGPYQDLNGYDHPWVGGTGKNLLPVSETDLKNTGVNYLGSWSGDVYSESGLTFTFQSDKKGNFTGVLVNGTATSDVTFCIVNGMSQPERGVILNGCPSGGSTTKYYLSCNMSKYDGSSYNAGDIGDQYIDTGNGATFDYDSSDSKNRQLRYFNVEIHVISGTICSSLLFQPMLRKADEADPTFELYSNLCPISYWSSVVLTRTGKNILPISAATQTISGVTFTVDNTAGTVTVSGTATATAFFAYSLTLQPGEYVLSGCPSGGSATNYRMDLRLSKAGYAFEDINGEVIDNGYSRTFYVTEKTTVWLNIRIQNGYTANNLVFRPMIRDVETDSTFAPYVGENYNLSLEGTDVAGDSLYGGSLDVLTGKLTVTHVLRNLGGYSWSMGTAGLFVTNITGIPKNVTADNFFCSAYEIDTTVGTPIKDYVFGRRSLTSTAVYVRDTRYANSTTFRSDLHADIVFPLEEPIVYQLTAQEVTTLLGENRFSVDEGQKVSVKYVIDVKSKLGLVEG